MNDDDEVGYGKPPKASRFRKGQSGNPGGRPRQQKPADDLRSILERVGNEEVEVGGVKRSMKEIEIISLQRKAAKGYVAASRHLAKLRADAGCDQPNASGGVLVVPGMSSLEDWTITAARHQAQYRYKRGDGE